MVRAISWVSTPTEAIRILDQTRLPLDEVYLDLTTVDQVITAIQTLAVRGAPALGAAGALGVALAMRQAEREGRDSAWLTAAIEAIAAARPTAVNLSWGVAQVRPRVVDGAAAVVRAAEELIAADTAASRELSRLGADWILRRCGAAADRGLRVLTHCNTGALATTGWGTAYGIIRELHERGRLDLVYADETRPLLQGARLTSWELTADGIDHVVQADGAASSTILRGLVDVAVFGADRITANGDTANKVGSVAVALACQRAGIPCVVAAPSSTVDLATASGDQIHIEERDGEEVVVWRGVRVAPVGARGFNPAFDVTPHDLISAIVTERGIVEPATGGGGLLARMLG